MSEAPSGNGLYHPGNPGGGTKGCPFSIEKAFLTPEAGGENLFRKQRGLDL
jgi:hypothetical protein